MPKPARALPALCLAATLPLLSACAGASAGAGSAANAATGAANNAAPSAATLALAERESATVAPGTVLVYDSVNDSRCPPDVQCVVAGKVTYSFTLKRGDASEAFTLTPAAPAYKSPAFGWRIVLADPAAPPVARAAAAPHPVTLKVTPQ